MNDCCYKCGHHHRAPLLVLAILLVVTYLVGIILRSGGDRSGLLLDVADVRERASVVVDEVGISLNQRLTFRKVVSSNDESASAVLRYCNASAEEEDCWEPNDLRGAWVAANTTTANINRTLNMCPGWNFGVYHCDNGYVMNLHCAKINYMERYHWQTSPSAPLSFDAPTTCQLLGNNRTVLILGDSTFGQTASALMNGLHPNHGGGSCRAQIKSVLSDTLLAQNLGRKHRGPHWRKAVSIHSPDIVIFGLGAHIFGEDIWRDAFHQVVQGMWEYQQSQRLNNNKTVHFVYKTQQPGGCSDTISPVSPDEAARTLFLANSTSRKYQNEIYNHDMFYGRDQYALAYLKQQSNWKWPIMDLRMLYARSDSHMYRDCLHLCSPGPLEDVVPMLFQDLLAHELRE